MNNNILKAPFFAQMEQGAFRTPLPMADEGGETLSCSVFGSGTAGTVSPVPCSAGTGVTVPTVPFCHLMRQYF